MNTVPSLEPQDISVDTFLEKYAKGNEQEIPVLQRRVALALASNEQDKEYWATVFYDAQVNGFIAGGRINSAAGMDSQSTLINCFIQPVGDSVSGYDDDGYPSIYVALGEAAETMRRGGGVGYDFSRIRPIEAYVKGTQSRASGPLSYMRVFDRSCETVESAGGRRGAQMGVLRCDHPDIFSFITAKRTEGEFNNFNLSIGVTDKFMKTVEEKGMWQLVHKSKPSQDYIKENNSYFDEESGKWIWKSIAAQDLWDLVMKSTYDFAEPGILFLDRMNEENNLYYCEVIEATNPCAEQPLPPYGCCDLGSINLTKFIRNPFTKDAYFDEEAFNNVVRVAIRMLDNVLDVTAWPLAKQQQEAKNKRRIGLGFMGIGDAIIMLGKWYNKQDGVEFASYVSRAMRDTAYRTSIDLAKEKGAFPFFDKDKYLAGKYISRLPQDIRDDISIYGLRNSHLLSIAPTGTIAIAFADNTSNGIEPPFSWVYDRKKRMADGSKKTFEVADHCWRLYRAMGHDVTKLPDNFVTALEMTVEAHTDIMKAVQPYIDTAISKTVNIPADYPYEKFKDLYMYAWKSGLKGLATYRPNAILGSVLSVKEEKTTVAPIVDEATSDIDNGKTLDKIIDEMYAQPFESREDGSLPGVSIKGRFNTMQGEQKFIITINFMTINRQTRFGVITIRRPVEFILTSNFTNSSSAWDASMRFMSLMGRSGVPITKVIENLREITWEHGSVRYGTKMKDDKQVPLWHSSDAAAIGYIIEEALIKDGYLSNEGKLAKKYKIVHNGEQVTVDAPVIIQAEVIAIETKQEPLPPTGKKCPECGAPNLVKRDGCSKCESCGYDGTCG